MTSPKTPCDYFLVAFLVTILTGVSNAQAGGDEYVGYPRVKISQGTLQGIHAVSQNGKNIATFLGIPYAKPPIGQLRFSNPVAPEPWIGIRNATANGSPCVQSGGEGSEDCLYLNVHTPRVPKNDNRLLIPVMVFVHGGAFQDGNGSSPPYGPGYLLQHDVVFVSMNYRLGPLGFLSTGDKVASGNWGLKDQVQALKWVQKNIAYFGGDPKRVTVFGQSAGGAAAQLLALSSSTKGLLHRYIAQSGSALAFWAYQPRSFLANATRRVGQILGCPTNTSSVLINCLRQRSITEISITRSQFYKWRNYPLMLWSPTNEPDIEGAFLTDDPAKLIAAGKISHIPSAIGMLKDDGLELIPGVVPGSPLFQEFTSKFDEVLPIVLQYWNKVKNESSFTAALKKYYFNNDLVTNQTQVWSKCVELFTDYLFNYPAYKSVRNQSPRAKNPSFLYSFHYRGNYSFSLRYGNDILRDRAIHSDDLLYLFPAIKLLFGAEPSETDLQVIEEITQLWTSFASTGKPKTTPDISNTTWAPYGSNRNYLRIGDGPDPKLELGNNYLQDRMQFWDDLIRRDSGSATFL